MKLVSTLLCTSALVLAGCSAAPRSGPEPEPTETGPVPVLTREGAEQLLASFDERANAVVLEVASSRDSSLWTAVETGPALLSAQFTTTGYERLDQEQPVGPWQRTLGDVWSPELGEHPLYALVSYDRADLSDETEEDETAADDAAEDGESGSDESDDIDWANLAVWVQDSEGAEWLMFAHTWVDSAKLSAPATVPLTEELAAPHRAAAQRLIDYLKGKDAPEVSPDQSMSDHVAGANVDDGITRQLDAALFTSSTQPVGPGGSIFPVQTAGGALGVVALRGYAHMSVDSDSYITLENDELRIAKGLEERLTSVTYKYAVTIAYLLGEDGTVEVIGSNFAHIE